MTFILGLFYLLTLVYLVRAIQLALLLWREWDTVRQEPFTSRKKLLAEQASFFLAVPVGVLLHEFFHALATWSVGGRVVEFAYRVFFGYVVPVGDFTPGEIWWISLAGTLGSLLFGLMTWLLLRRHSLTALRYFGLRVFRFQVYFSLIYYPLFTLLGFVGDWATIYDFAATPLLSGATAVVHALLLLLFWRGDRVGWFEHVAYDSLEAQTRFHTLAESAHHNPDLPLQMQYIAALRQGGATHQAIHTTQQLLRQHPQVGALHLELAVLQSERQKQMPLSAVNHVRQALACGLPTPEATAVAHQILGRYYLDTHYLEEAISHYSQAMALTTSPHPHLYYWRSLAYRQQQQYHLAYQDVQQALRQTGGEGETAVFYQNELALIEKHAGRKLDTDL